LHQLQSGAFIQVAATVVLAEQLLGSLVGGINIVGDGGGVVLLKHSERGLGCYSLAIEQHHTNKIMLLSCACSGLQRPHHSLHLLLQLLDVLWVLLAF